MTLVKETLPKVELHAKVEPERPETPKKAESNTENVATYTTEFSSRPPVAIQFANGCVQETAVLQPGPDGFLMAQFSDGHQKSFELPNLVLETLLRPTHDAPTKLNAPIKKRPASACKRPAASEKSQKTMPQDATEPQPSAAEAEPADNKPSENYGIMYYKNGHQIGIRAKKGMKNQVLSFGSTSCGKTKEEMKAIGLKVVAMLDNGCTFQEGKDEGLRLMRL